MFPEKLTDFIRDVDGFVHKATVIVDGNKAAKCVQTYHTSMKTMNMKAKNPTVSMPR